LRQVELAGPPPIDPSRTELTEAWRALPAFLVEPGSSLSLKEVRRGEAEAPPDALGLAREFWLDADGHGASVRDRFSGTLRATTRLDLVPPGALGRIAVGGQDQLVTANPETREAGIELRRSALQLEADSHVALGGAIPAVGWTTGVERLQATLHVPPGWSLLAASGIDRVPGTWTSRWTLLAFFFVLIVTLAVHRLFGLRPAILALAALVLTHGEPDAPFGVWLSLVAATALARVAPAGRIARVSRLWFLASAAALVVAVVPFARDQVKAALFPQVADIGAFPVERLPTMPAQPGIAGGEVEVSARAAASLRPPRWRPPPRSPRTRCRRWARSSRAPRKRCRRTPSARSREAGATSTTSRSSRTRRPSCRQGPGSQPGPGAAIRSRGAGPWAAITGCGSSSPRPG
jgi:hypothetical protein